MGYTHIFCTLVDHHLMLTIMEARSKYDEQYDSKTWPARKPNAAAILRDREMRINRQTCSVELKHRDTDTKEKHITTVLKCSTKRTLVSSP